MSLGDGFRPTYVNVEPKFLQGVILTLDQHSIADSFSALIAGTRRVSPLVQKVNIFKDNEGRYDMYRL